MPQVVFLVQLTLRVKPSSVPGLDLGSLQICTPDISPSVVSSSNPCLDPITLPSYIQGSDSDKVPTSSPSLVPSSNSFMSLIPTLFPSCPLCLTSSVGPSSVPTIDPGVPSSSQICAPDLSPKVVNSSDPHIDPSIVPSYI